ncbi:hypothetical protein C8R47DRAFT_1165893 [Mycena vitilis]|nr:hypothetical protein C8R47DRAFT_1165893 [Mycena vitilis]
MAFPRRDPLETVIRDVLLYPVDGSEPRLIPMSFSQYGAKKHPSSSYAVDMDLTARYGIENMAGICTKAWNVNARDSPDEQYVLYHNLSPDLPANVALAGLVGVDPKGLTERLMWRGDVFVARRRKWTEPSVPGEGLHIDYVDVPLEAMKLLNSSLIPQWYRSKAWKSFHQEELEKSKSQVRWRLPWPFNAERTASSREIYENRAEMLRQLIAYSQPPDELKSTVNDVLLYPADGGEPRIIPMRLYPPIQDLPAHELHFHEFNLDLRAIYGLENIFATRRLCLDSPDYVMHYNLSPALPINLAMAKMAGVDLKNLDKRPMWRGDVIMLKGLTTEWDYRTRTFTPAHALDMPSDVIQHFNSRLIPELYDSPRWRYTIDNEELYETARPVSADIEFQRISDKMKRLLAQLRIIHPREDPHKAVFRDVILYPADGGEPRITPMVFNREGAEALKHELHTTWLRWGHDGGDGGDERFTINVDLRGLYGPEKMFATRAGGCELRSGVKWTWYYNISPALPVNKAMARLLGGEFYHDTSIGRRFWCTGDLVAVKRAEWLSYPIEHLDMGPEDLKILHSSLPNWYDSFCWESFLEKQKRLAEEIEEAGRPRNWQDSFNGFLSGKQNHCQLIHGISSLQYLLPALGL